MHLVSHSLLPGLNGTSGSHYLISPTSLHYIALPLPFSLSLPPSTIYQEAKSRLCMFTFVSVLVANVWDFVMSDVQPTFWLGAGSQVMF